MLTQLVFHDAGAAILLVLFVILYLVSPFKFAGKNIHSGDLNLLFSIVLVIYVAWRIYGN
jgi:hypothetical protein